MKSVGGIVLAHAVAFGLVAAVSACPADPSNADGGTDGDLPCLEREFGNGTDGSTNPIMETWGAPCTTDEECVALIGEGGECQSMAVIYELPGGYCSKPCTLPDMDTRVVVDDPACDPAGGVNCIGQKGFFERCAAPCTDDAQCNRDGYYCRVMPMIGKEGDAKACLMPDCCQDTCESS